MNQNEWHVSALEGYFTDSVEANSTTDAVTSVLPFMIKSLRSVTELSEWIEVCAWQEGDETCECFFFQMPANGEPAQILNSKPYN